MKYTDKEKLERRNCNKWYAVRVDTAYYPKGWYSYRAYGTECPWVEKVQLIKITNLSPKKREVGFDRCDVNGKRVSQFWGSLGFFEHVDLYELSKDEVDRLI